MSAPTQRYAGSTKKKCVKCDKVTQHEILEILPRSAEERHTTQAVCLECKPEPDDYLEE